MTVVGATAAQVAQNSKVSTPMVDYEITMYMSNNVPINSKLYIQFPLAWSVADPSFVMPSGVTCLLYCDIANTNIILTKNNADNTLIVTNLFPSFQRAPGPLKVRLTGNTNPPTTSRMYFTITTYNEDGQVYKIDESTSRFFLDFQPGVIAIGALYPNDLEILSSIGTWTFSLTPEHPVDPTYVMVIAFPSTVSVQQRAGCTIVGANINPSYSCNADGATNKITITNMFAALQAANT